MDIMEQRKEKQIGRWVKIGIIVLLLLAGFVFRREFFSSRWKKVTAVRIGLVCLSLGFSLLLALLPRKKQKEGKSRLFLSLAFALLCLPYGYLTGEFLLAQYDRQYGLLSALMGTSIFTPSYVALNIFFLSILCLFFIALTGNIKLGALCGISFHILYGVVNPYVYAFRGAAITFSDFYSVGTALKVVGSYEVKLTFPVYLVLCLMTVPWMASFHIQGCSLLKKGRKYYLAGLCSGLAVVALCLRLFVVSPWLEDLGVKISYYNTYKSYIHRGLALNFARSIWSSML
ncbi:MAG: hypothetical protein IIY58_00840, partial [Aeriscardovia sp.]|nr:hypothetical protein [Aeriscardovia sp.]